MPHTYEGYRFTELLWQLAPVLEMTDVELDTRPNGEGYAAAISRLGDKLDECYNVDADEYTQDGKFIIGEMRAFLAAHVDRTDARRPLWEGLAKVEDDFFFCRFFLMLIWELW